MLGIAVLLFSLQAAGDALPEPHPIAMEEGVAVFKRLCMDGFPDPARAQVARTDQALALVQVPKPVQLAQQPGERWVSEQVDHSYVDAAWLPRDLPSPQCAVVFSITEQRNHRALAEAIAPNLALANGKLGKDRPRDTSRWDMEQADGTTHRLFLETVATNTGTQVSLRLLNLRD